MAFIIEVPNAFEPLHNIKKHQHPGGVSIREWLRLTYPGFEEFEIPTVCIVNGEALLRKDWDRKIEDNDVVNFVAVPLGIVTIITIILVAVSISISLYFALAAPGTPGELPASDPVFSTKGQQNQIRLGEPIEVSYGRNRIYPSFAARPYFQYQDNDQFQYALFCIGQGEYEIDQILIGETVIDNFQEVEYEIVRPAAKVTLFPTNVFTSPEAGGQTLFAPNEEEYSGDGFVGPFIANQAGTQTNEIQLDITLPKGIYSTSKKGGLTALSVSIDVQYREIDDAGAPLGDWEIPFIKKKTEVFVSENNQEVRTFRGKVIERFNNWEWVRQSLEFTETESGDGPVGTVTNIYSDAIDSNDPTDREGVTWTRIEILPDEDGIVIEGATTTPQRRTYVLSVPLSRYEVRIRRQDDKVISHRAGHDVVWEGMRAFIDVEPDFGLVTMLAVVIKATNNLNERTQSKFSVVCTRKIPIRESGGWILGPQTSRSIVWALVDVFRNFYGGRIVDDAFFDFDTLEELDDFYTTRGEYFDWIFRDPITVWEAAVTIARVGRAAPILVGSLITMKRDGPLEIPVAMFTPDNIVEGTFTWQVKLWDLDEFDSVRVEYTEASSGFKQETVVATLPDSDATSDNPEDVRIVGIQDRNHAYREGLYLRATKKYLRENATFETGLEGYIPAFGDLIAVVHDVPRWGQSGYIVHAESIGGSDVQLYLSEPIAFDDSGTYQIYLRGNESQLLGPFTAFETSDPKQVIIQPSGTIDFLLGGENEPMLFLFGVSGNITKYMKVVKIEPQGGERIKITAVNDEPIIHSFDSLEAPPLGSEIGPPEPPDLPEIEELILTQIDDILLIVQAAWTAAFGAQYYVVQSSEDGVNWTNQGTTTRTAVQLQVFPGDLWVRVAAVNNGQGPWIQAQTSVSHISGLDVTIPWTLLEWEISWGEVLDAVGFEVKVYDNTGSDPVLKKTLQQTTRTFNYDFLDASDDDNVVREHLVTVDALFIDEDTGLTVASGLPAQEDLTQTAPNLPPFNLSSTIDSVDSDEVFWELSWELPAIPDLVRIKVWVSETNGFDPEVEVPVLDETSSSIGPASLPTSTIVSLPFNSFGSIDNHYWRVAIFDPWGDEIDLNISAQQTIPAELVPAGSEYDSNGEYLLSVTAGKNYLWIGVGGETCDNNGTLETSNVAFTAGINQLILGGTPGDPVLASVTEYP